MAQVHHCRMVSPLVRPPPPPRFALHKLTGQLLALCSSFKRLSPCRTPCSAAEHCGVAGQRHGMRRFGLRDPAPGYEHRQNRARPVRFVYAQHKQHALNALSSAISCTCVSQEACCRHTAQARSCEQLEPPLPRCCPSAAPRRAQSEPIVFCSVLCLWLRSARAMLTRRAVLQDGLAEARARCATPPKRVERKRAAHA